VDDYRVFAVAEVIVLIVLVIYSFRPGRWRRTAVAALGAVTPFFAFYVDTAIAFFRDPGDSNRFAFYAMWLMGAIPFFACLALVALLAQIPRPKNLFLSYVIGLGISLFALWEMLLLGSPPGSI
jgi:hypothetical protein